MPEGLRKLFLEQYVETDGKFVEKRLPKVQEPIRTENATVVPDLNPEINWTPYRAMNVGADEVALKELNRTEQRYYQILKARPELVWIGVKTMRFRIAANTHYTPDFQSLDKDGIMTQYDSKGGFTREDSQLKMKLVARMFPFFQWVKAELNLATRNKAESLKETVFKA